MNKVKVRLTQYSHGAGCGCKISPNVLEEIIGLKIQEKASWPGLLVGNDSKDDAAVFDLGNGTSAISTTDFFMPIVDDPFDFGRIASVNAISDIYAMGGKPLMAIAILGWPVDKLSPAIAKEVLNGSRAVCRDAHIPLAGGHSIDNAEPLFGLAVTGIVKNEHLKRNNTARVGDLLYLTKPVGVGIITTAQKKGIVNPDDLKQAVNSMLTLNNLGSELGKLEYVSAVTDVTGFGLAGHLLEMCEGSGLSAAINFNQIPMLDNLHIYVEQECYPGGTKRNLGSYGLKVKTSSNFQRIVLADPQTSGGLLIAVNEAFESHFDEYISKIGTISKIGRLEPKTNYALLIS